MDQQTEVESARLNSASSNIRARAWGQREGGEGRTGGTSAELCLHKSAWPAPLACTLQGEAQTVFSDRDELNSSDGKKRGAFCQHSFV